MKVKNIMFSGFAAAILMGAVDANAAGLSIASQEYVDSKVGAETSARTTALQSYSTTQQMNTAITEAVSAEETRAKAAEQANADAIAAEVTARQTLAQTVDGLTGTGADSVDSKIDTKVADALGADFPANSTVKAELDKKQNASDSTVAAADAGTYTAITAGNGVGANLVALDGKLKTAETTIASHATSIANNATAISTETTNRTDADAAINDKIGSGFDSTNTVAKKIADEKTRAEGAESGLNTRLNSVETTLGNGTTEGLVKDVNNLKSNMGNAGSVADQIESVVGSLGTNATTGEENTVEEALAKKVDKTTTVNAKALTGDIVLDGGDVAVKTGYAKATAAEAIAAGNTIDSALGKLEYKADANTNAIAALNDTYATDAEVNAKFGGVANALPVYTACTAESGQCVLSVDKTTGALTWVAVTPAPTSGN